MRIPDDSLDDFKKAAGPKWTERPLRVTLRLTGETEVLKPLACWDGPTKTFRGLRWFHRSLAAGGALAVAALIILTGIYIGIYGPSIEPVVSPTDVALEVQPGGMSTPADELSTSDLLPDQTSPYVVRAAARRKPARPRMLIAAYRPIKPLIPQFVVSQFVPTTLVIYVENGEIKTRLEPQPTAGYKKPLTFPN